MIDSSGCFLLDQLISCLIPWMSENRGKEPKVMFCLFYCLNPKDIQFTNIKKKNHSFELLEPVNILSFLLKKGVNDLR